MTTRFIKVIDFYQTPDYERNYDKNCYNEYVCECCGRKLNPETMHGVQMLESGHWTNETEEVKTIYENGKPTGMHSQGFFYIGPKCYQKMMKRIEASNETVEVEI